MKKMRVRIRIALFLIAGAWCCGAQEPASAGGKWLRSEEIDGPSSKKVVRFFLPADEAELGREPRIELVCTGDGKLVRARYFADADLTATTGDFAHYDDPAITPKIRIDKKIKFEPVWDLLDAKGAQLDRKTVRALFKGTEMRVNYTDKTLNHFLDVFIIGGLNAKQVRTACGDNGWFSK